MSWPAADEPIDTPPFHTAPQPSGLKADAQGVRFDGNIDADGNCPFVQSGTVWEGQLVVTGSFLPGEGPAARTWDGEGWGTIGLGTEVQSVRAFGDRLLGWTQNGSVFEMIADAWVQVGDSAPGTVADITLVDGEIVVCGVHRMGGGYVAAARTGS